MNYNVSGNGRLTFGLHVRLAYMHLSSAGVTLYTAFPDEARKLRDKRVKVNTDTISELQPFGFLSL